MKSYPDGLNEAHAGKRPGARHWNYLPLLVLGPVMLLALLGLFGGDRSDWLTASAPSAELRVHSPQILRSGVFFETRIAVEARGDIEDATIGVSSSLWRDMTINTTLPEADAQEDRAGTLRLHYGRLKAGDRMEVKIDGQVNPPLFAGTRGQIALFDGDKMLVGIPLEVKVLP